MVSKAEIEQFMLSYFPTCPLCGAEKGYEVSGISKTYVQCRVCDAKWTSGDLSTLALALALMEGSKEW